MTFPEQKTNDEFVDVDDSLLPWLEGLGSDATPPRHGSNLKTIDIPQWRWHTHQP